MPATALHKAIEAGETVAHTIEETTRANMEAARQGMREMRRSLKRSYEAAVEAQHETERLIKKYPWKSAAVVFGAGLGIGLLAGWALKRRA